MSAGGKEETMSKKRYALVVLDYAGRCPAQYGIKDMRYDEYIPLGIRRFSDGIENYVFFKEGRAEIEKKLDGYNAREVARQRGE